MTIFLLKSNTILWHQQLKEIIKKYPLISKDNITGHSEIAPNRKTDPGNKFDWEKYLKLV